MSVKGHPMRAAMGCGLRGVKGAYLEKVDLGGAELFHDVHGSATLRTSPDGRCFSLVCGICCWDLMVEQVTAERE